MPIDPANAREGMAELGEYANDVRQASPQTATNAIQRYVDRLDTEPVLIVARASLPEVDFDAWFAAAKATIGSMVGSGRLNWPVETRERVALQAELLRRFAGGQIDLIEYTYDFHYVENRFSSNIQQFVVQDFEPFHRDFLRLATGTIEELERQVNEPSAVPIPEVGVPPHGGVLLEYVSQVRLTELRAIRSARYDLRKLIRLCEELDISFRNQCYLAAAALTRALLDHVPPIFGVANFSEVANNYAGSGKSFRDSMQHLQNSARRIGDTHLHA